MTKWKKENPPLRGSFFTTANMFGIGIGIGICVLPLFYFKIWPSIYFNRGFLKKKESDGLL